MKTPPGFSVCAATILGAAAVACGQTLDFSADRGSMQVSASATPYQVPGVRPAACGLPASELVLANQASPVGPSRPQALTHALAMPTELSRLARQDAEPALQASLDELRIGLALMTAVYRPEGSQVATIDCPLVAVVVERRVAAEPGKVLEIVATELGHNPNCACEIVKAAIKGCEADAETVAAIVETACGAAPEMMRLISQCAIAVAPESLAAVQAVLARIDPAAGSAVSVAKGIISAKSAESAEIAESAKSAKSSKSAKGEPLPPLPRYADPLDRFIIVIETISPLVAVRTELEESPKPPSKAATRMPKPSAPSSKSPVARPSK